MVAVYFLLPEGYKEPSRRLAAIFVFAVGFWAFEIIPLYATSLTLVVLLTFFLAKPGSIEGFSSPHYTQFLIPFSSPVIMLFLGGFFLASAAAKHHVFLVMMQKILARFGGKSSHLLLIYLFMSGFFSMWISDTATAAMLLILLDPILACLDQDDPLRKSLVLAICFGSVIGGMATPIGTPPNAIALGILAEHQVFLSFFSWVMMTLPLTLILLTLAFFILRALFAPKYQTITIQVQNAKGFSKRGIGVIIILALTVTLWLTSPLHHIPEAMISLLAIALLSATRLVDKEDLKRIDWDILLLMWGGLALGKGLMLSGIIDQVIELPVFSQHGAILVISLTLLAFFLSSIISNTATANLLLPIAASFAGFERITLSITIALACSFAFIFPISTPANALAYGKGLLSMKDMFKAGSLLAIAALILVILGYQFIIPKFFHY
ncbi:MAG: DASS family sodium-coupled anion symporter [Simkaniaceae bacterium]|nr:DASS family sodium-coupled anion symporter [Simkaniaceae bacterium]